jgi:uncharacterized protein (TIRG00374 family)
MDYPKKHHKIKVIIRNIISIGFIVGLGYYLWKHWGVFYTAFDASWHHALSISVCMILSWMINSCQILLILKKMGFNIGFWENLYLFVAAALGNYLPMRMGTLLRARYLKKLHGVHYITFTGMVGIRTLIFLASTGILGCIGMAGLKLSGTKINLAFLTIFICMAVFSLGLCLMRKPKMNNAKNSYIKAWSDFLTGFEAVWSSPIFLFQNIALVFLQYFLLAIRLFVVFDTFQIELSVWALIILAPTTTLITFVSLTPGSLGVREWAIGAISVLSGIDFQGGIFAGTIDRAVLMACTFIFGSFSLLYIWIRLKNPKPRNTI